MSLAESVLIQLHEIEYQDRFRRAAEAMRRHPNDFIHFGYTDKIGIRTRAGHNDLPGVYFYPIPWVLNTVAHETSGPYRTDAPHFFVCSVDLKNPSGLCLNERTPERFRRIAQRNGWGTFYDQALERPTNFFSLHPHRTVRTLSRDGHAGAIFYATGDALSNKSNVFGKEVPQWKWSVLMKGVAYLEDRGEGIINPNEPAQTVVIDPRAYKVLESDDNKRFHLAKSFAVDLFSELSIEYSMELNRGRALREAVGWVKSKKGPIKVSVSGVGENDQESSINGNHVYVEASWMPHADDPDGRFNRFIQDRAEMYAFTPVYTFSPERGDSLQDQVRAAVNAVETRVDLIQEFETIQAQPPWWTPALAQQVLKRLLTLETNEKVKVWADETMWSVSVVQGPMTLSLYHYQETRTLRVSVRLQNGPGLTVNLSEKGKSPQDVMKLVATYLRQRVMELHTYVPQEGRALVDQAGLNPQILQGVYA